MRERCGARLRANALVAQSTGDDSDGSLSLTTSGESRPVAMMGGNEQRPQGCRCPRQGPIDETAVVPVANRDAFVLKTTVEPSGTL